MNFIYTQLWRWQKPGDITKVPKMTPENYAAGVFSSRFMSDASYIRLKNITLGYNLNPKIAEKLGLTSARIYVSGQNLITITNYIGLDPQLNGASVNPLVKGLEEFTVPHSKSYRIGIKISF